MGDDAPQLTIHHDGAADSNAFEGPEKLLEVWFAPSPASLPATAHPSGLKCVPVSSWEPMLDLVNCKILSVLESDPVDAYLLSESSMFVFPHKLILKTCGTTTLLLGLHRLLHVAAAEAGFPFGGGAELGEGSAATPYRVFYSRKNFLFPDKQRGPHRSWNDEVSYLDGMFDGGSAYLVGKMNGDHWFLYMTRPAVAGSPDAKGGEDGLQHDETLEILMTDLDPDNAKQFYFDGDADDESASHGHVHGTEATRRCGLSDIYPTGTYPDAKIDSYLFSPCGYSANGLVPSSTSPGAAGQYWTVHVTPEPSCSFASFETNVAVAGAGSRPMADIVGSVVGVFRPGRFSVTLFEAKGSPSDQAARAAATKRLGEEVEGYRRIDGIVHDFDDYDLVFLFYERVGWKGGQGTRVGEIIC